MEPAIGLASPTSERTHALRRCRPCRHVHRSSLQLLCAHVVPRQRLTVGLAACAARAVRAGTCRASRACTCCGPPPTSLTSPLYRRSTACSTPTSSTSRGGCWDLAWRHDLTARTWACSRWPASVGAAFTALTRSWCAGGTTQAASHLVSCLPICQMSIKLLVASFADWLPS